MALSTPSSRGSSSSSDSSAPSDRSKASALSNCSSLVGMFNNTAGVGCNARCALRNADFSALALLQTCTCGASVALVSCILSFLHPLRGLPQKQPPAGLFLLNRGGGYFVLVLRFGFAAVSSDLTRRVVVVVTTICSPARAPLSTV